MTQLTAWWKNYQVKHPLIERLVRNTTAWAIFAACVYFVFNVTLLHTYLNFVAVMVLVFIVANIGLWIYSKINHDSKDETPVVRAALILGVLLVTGYVAGQMLSGFNNTAQIENINQEFQTQDSVHAVTIQK